MKNSVLVYSFQTYLGERGVVKERECVGEWGCRAIPHMNLLYYFLLKYISYYSDDSH